jgi:hypothetical protein
MCFGAVFFDSASGRVPSVDVAPMAQQDLPLVVEDGGKGARLHQNMLMSMPPSTWSDVPVM